jgi:hypothetical protein
LRSLLGIPHLSQQADGFCEGIKINFASCFRLDFVEDDINIFKKVLKFMFIEKQERSATW